MQATVVIDNALTAGASAGESWVVQVQALASLAADASAGDAFTGLAEGAIAAALAAGTEASSQFVGAAQALASITGAAGAGAVFSATGGEVLGVIIATISLQPAILASITLN